MVQKVVPKLTAVRLGLSSDKTYSARQVVPLVHDRLNQTKIPPTPRGCEPPYVLPGTPVTPRACFAGPILFILFLLRTFLDPEGKRQGK